MLTVPDSAVIDTGTRRIVLVQVDEGRFEPREVELGGRGENYVEVVKGVREGEQVVVAANFLIDAESNLKAAVGGWEVTLVTAVRRRARRAAATPPRDGRPQGRGHVDASTEGRHRQHQPWRRPSLKWPAMTMEFKVANVAAERSEAGSRRFEFVERQPGEYVVTDRPSPTAAGRPRAPAPLHSGH